MRHRDGDATVGVCQCRDPIRRAVWIATDSFAATLRSWFTYRYATRPLFAHASAAAVEANSAWPSPCATAIGRNDPAMPSSTTDGERRISTSANRDSYCSLRFRTKRGQCCGSGNDALQRREHLAAVADAEREGVGAREEALELLAHGLVEQNRLRPALPGSQHVAVGESAAGDEPLELLQRAPPGKEVVMCTSCGVKPARSKTAAVSIWLLTPCSRRIATAGRTPRAM